MRKVHEHIIQIPPFVTRDQLWNGLEKAARHPDRFVEHMEGCELLSERLIEGARHLGREVSFGGGFRLRDKVILREGESVTTVVEAGESWPASTFPMKIDEPEEALNPMIEQLRRQAYEAKDRALIEQVLKNIPQGELS